MDDLEDVHRIIDLETQLEPGSLEQRAEWLRWTMMNDVQLEWLHQPPYGDKAVVLKESNRLIGAVGLVPAVTPAAQLPYYSANPTPNARIRPEVGLYYAFDPAYQRKGYATEAVRALVDYAFKELRLERIIATTDYANERSQAMMRRLGMSIQRNPFLDPFWCEVVGILEHPDKQME